MKQIKIDKKLLNKVIKLSKIEIEKEEEDKLLRDFSNIVKEFEKLQELKFPHKNDNVIFQQVINQYSQFKKFDVSPEKIIELFPQKRENNPYVPPIQGEEYE